MSNTRVYVSFPTEVADAFRITTQHRKTSTLIGLEADNKEDLEILAGSLKTMQSAVQLQLTELGEAQ